jgi:hypothetical protein
MKLLSVGLARVVWVFDTTHINPRGLSFQEIIQRLSERYRFAKGPKTIADVSGDKSFTFEFGTFVNSKKLPLAVTFKLYGDGMVTDTWASTEDCTEFMQDLSSWAEHDFGFVIPDISKINVGYLSQINVESDIKLSSITPKFVSLAKILDSKVKPMDRKSRQFEMAGISFWTEDSSKPQAPAAFRFEKKLGVPFGDKEYFSQAALGTQEHLDLLRQFEKLFSP